MSAAPAHRPAAPAAPPHGGHPRGPRLAQLPAGGTAAKRLAAVRKLRGRRRRAAWRQRLVDAERGLVLGFRRDGVLCGHVFVLTLAAAAGVVLNLDATRWAVLGVALGTAMGAELFGQVLAALAAAAAKTADADAVPEELAAAVRLCGAAVAVTAAGACCALVAVFAPPVAAAFG